MSVSQNFTNDHDPLGLERTLTIEDLSPSLQLNLRIKVSALQNDFKLLTNLLNCINFLAKLKTTGETPRNMRIQLNKPYLQGTQLSTDFARRLESMH